MNLLKNVMIMHMNYGFRNNKAKCLFIKIKLIDCKKNMSNKKMDLKYEIIK